MGRDDSGHLDSLLRPERLGRDARRASIGGGFYGALMTGDALMVLATG